MKGPDGTDNWLYISCSSSQELCLDEAAARCPSGYDTSSEGGHTVVSGANGHTSSSFSGHILVKCRDRVASSSGSSASTKSSRSMDDSAGPSPANMPRRLGGFKLAAAMADALAQCEEAGNTWSTREGGGECSKTIESGAFEGPVQVRAFKDRVYTLRMLTDVKGDTMADWMTAMKLAMRPFVNAAGAAGKSNVVFPERCKKDMIPCLKSGDASAFARWDWPKRGYAEVRTFNSESAGARPQIEVVLSMPARDDSADDEPAKAQEAERPEPEKAEPAKAEKSGKAGKPAKVPKAP